jgi:SAM-dependent methyltransferase
MDEEYERWSKRFAGAKHAFGEAPNAFLARQRPLLPSSGTALSVSDGDGRNGVWLAEQGSEVTTFDLIPVAVEQAGALAAKRGVSIDAEVADIVDYAWPNEVYDVVAVIFIQYVRPAERTAVFGANRRALKPGGLLPLEGYTPKQVEFGTGGLKQVENMYPRELLKAELSEFASLEIDEYEAEPQEGTSHAGRSALIDLVAPK